MRSGHNASRMQSFLLKMTALVLAMTFLPFLACAESAEEKSEWVNFLLICNEGMNNEKGNAGNTLMMVAMNPAKGLIHLLSFTWDTFIDYEGYDVPQKLDMPYRNNGPEEAMKILDANFGLDLEWYMSLNFLNLASLIDEYGGVSVNLTRAERNALNGMVASKKEQLKAQVARGLLEQAMIDKLAQNYYLTEYGPNTELNGLQAVGYGWLQYDSVYNCCERDLEVVSCLFERAAKTIGETVIFYTDETGFPEELHGRLPINLDDVRDTDKAFLREAIAPMFDMTDNNLNEEIIEAIYMSLAKAAYEASRQGTNIFAQIKTLILPLEAKNEYDIVAGAKGHLVDKEANSIAIREFLYQTEE